MFHVERNSLIYQGFWRGRASSSSTTTFFGVPRAILSSRATIVKSFLHDWVKFFSKDVVSAGLDPVPALVVYAQGPGLSRTFCGNYAFVFKSASLAAPIIQ
jgi:hypothetical protein